MASIRFTMEQWEQKLAAVKIAKGDMNRSDEKGGRSPGSEIPIMHGDSGIFEINPLATGLS
jgi:hypothetical protein